MSVDGSGLFADDTAHDVLLLGSEGGPYVFDAKCDYQQIQLQWLEPAMLEVNYGRSRGCI
jgi:hypothetical protein